MDFDDLVEHVVAPEKRAGKVVNGVEHKMHEGAVMVAYAMHLFRTSGADHVRIHPDGEHGKRFDFAGWLSRRGFEKISSSGTTSYGGDYEHECGWRITINPSSGRGDVVAEVGRRTISAECKGGIINTRHSGQVSRLYKGLCETVGLLMAGEIGRPPLASCRIPNKPQISKRMVPRCLTLRDRDRLVGSHGEVIGVTRDAKSKIVQECPLPQDMHIREDYRVFPTELEDDPGVVFHSTAAENLDPIIAEGFKRGSEAGATLNSISYARTSSAALHHWTSRRSKGQDGIILALRFESYEGLHQEPQLVYDYKEVPTQPEIIGFVKVPTSYVHR
ncbi:MAG: hypothetical protein KF849_00080 [Rhizobiaceae bacterium]|nr:hypothetical protein [Rhizobiaceae bacterium]